MRCGGVRPISTSASSFFSTSASSFFSRSAKLISTSANFDFGQFRLRPISISANFDFGQSDFGELAEVELSEVELAEVEHPREVLLVAFFPVD